MDACAWAGSSAGGVSTRGIGCTCALPWSHEYSSLVIGVSSLYQRGVIAF